MTSEIVSTKAAPTALPDGLAAWQRRILNLVLADGLSPLEAATQCNVSPASLDRFTRPDPVTGILPPFAIALARAASGLSDASRESLRAQAAAYAGVVIDDAYRESRSKELYPRDRLGNRNLLLQAAQVVGVGRDVAGAQALAAISVTIIVDGVAGAPSTVVKVEPVEPSPV